MAKKISQLTQATQVKSDDVTVIVQDGETKKLPLNMMVTKQDIENKKVAGLAKLDEIEATYENDTYTPTIAVKNKSSVKVGEGDGVDYSANVMDGHVKSAILKGNTLVNIKTKYNPSPTPGSWFISVYDINTLKINTKYLIKVFNKTNIDVTLYISAQNATGLEFEAKANSIGVGTITTKSEINNDVMLRLRSSSEDVIGFDCNILLLEYQEGMENWDIPYFEGMQSVKLPVLTTVGKNLFNINGYSTKNQYASINGNTITVNAPTTFSNTIYTLTGLKEGELYRVSLDKIGLGEFSIRDKNNSSALVYVENEEGHVSRTFTYKKGATLRMGNREIVNSELSFANIQIEHGSTETTYEPYKSNILTVNEEVELRGVGDVQDTLDCLTGEVTQRIGDTTFNGSERWTLGTKEADNTIRFKTVLQANIPVVNEMLTIICDNFPVLKNADIDVESVQLWGSSKDFTVRILKTKASTVDEFKSYLSQNPITIQYELATESVKTVDLMPSGTHPSTTPYCWKNGHIQLSSSGLLPNLEYSVVTSRAGQINQNATMIVKNDKRIFDLEILLAGGLVNTTYQALTLQNQVETGLSKVSLNSEKEPDYLLYHMIMKLIEEKAYKLDDLTEKVSVFYLYEKLSDEQFETIYSALYPFAEDEIIEEPVVEELPEVVEDEVIM